MKVRPFDFGKDYPQVCEWWRHYGWSYLPKTRLSPVGLVCEVGGEPACAVWVYLTGSDLFLIEFLVGNPAVVATKKHKAIVALLEAAKRTGFEAGAKVPVTYVKQKSLMRLYARAGFKPTAEKMTEMTWGLA